MIFRQMLRGISQMLCGISQTLRGISQWVSGYSSWRFGSVCGRLRKVRSRLYSMSYVTGLGLLTCCLSVLLGIGLAHAIETPYGMVDPVDARYEAGYVTYLEQCAACHIALPPAILPAETWQVLITESAHYGVSVPVLSSFEQQLMLNYLQTYSRRTAPRASVPFRVKDSTYFYALHPGVVLPQPLDLRSCAGCHVGANEQDFSAINAVGT
ncbi:MAG: diheme cytochrome C [Cyanobacteria bacterium J06554_3]